MSASETITTVVPWPTIHDAARALDAVRGRIGRSGVSDAFGGSYFGGDYEARGIAGLAMIARATDSIATAAWQIVHDARANLDHAVMLDLHDVTIGDWYHVAPSGDRLLCVSRRAARWRATHGGGTVEREDRVVRIPRVGRVERRRRAEDIMAGVREAVRAAIALHDLRTVLAATGIIEYRGNVICGRAGSVVHLQGLAWLRGETDDSGEVSIEDARAFLADGSAAAIGLAMERAKREVAK